MADPYTPVGTWDLVPDTFPDTVKVMRPSVRSSASAGVVLRRQTQSSESPAGVAAKRFMACGVGGHYVGHYGYQALMMHYDGEKVWV